MSTPTHGTIYAYRKGCRCDPCVQENYRRNARWRVRASGQPIPESAHGTANGYKVYGCRCDRCKQARKDDAAVATEKRRRLRELVDAGLPLDWEGEIPKP